MLPLWMRVAMVATAALNVAGAMTFLPAAGSLRAMGGLPVDSHPLYLCTLSVFTLTFGLGYLWSGVTGRADRLFIAVGATGKIAFFAVLVWCWSEGTVGATAPLSGLGDLIVGGLFVAWLLGAPPAPTSRP